MNLTTQISSLADSVNADVYEKLKSVNPITVAYGADSKAFQIKIDLWSRVGARVFRVIGPAVDQVHHETVARIGASTQYFTPLLS